MNTRSPRIAFIGSLVALFFSALAESYAQDAGIGTFNDLVGQAIEAPPPPTISYPETTILSFDGKETVPTTKTGSVFRLQPGVEYDYRFNQQKIGDRFETDINEAHTSLLLSLTRTKFLIEYAHTWSDASNDVMLKRNSESDGIKLS